MMRGGRPRGSASRNLSWRERTVNALRQFAIALWRNRRGQDLIEYALISALVAVAVGAVMPSAAASIASIHSKISAHASRVAGF
jgi:Flp pilus assembly pilin Flp